MGVKNGRTPLAAQYALMGVLKELFDGKTYCGQGGRKALTVYKQDLPVPQDNDEDVDTVQAAAPWLMVRRTGTTVEKPNAAHIAEFELTICCYDEGKDRDGYDDVANISDKIMQRFHEKPYFEKHFAVEYPIASAVQQDDTAPYYFGVVLLRVTTQLKPTNTEVEALL